MGFVLLAVAVMFTTGPMLYGTGSPASAGVLTLNQDALSFCHQLGATPPGLQGVVLNSTGTALSFTAGSLASWIQISPSAGTTPSAVAVGVVTTGLDEGVYDDAVYVSSADGASALTISVRLVVSRLPCLSADPPNLKFTYRVGAARPDARCSNLNTSARQASFAAAVSYDSWLAVTPTVGALPGRVCGVVEPVGLLPGEYRTTIQLSTPGVATASLTIPVTLTVLPLSQIIVPVLRLSPGTLYFDHRVGAAQPPPQVFTVTSTTVATTVLPQDVKVPWFAVIPSSAATPATFVVMINPVDLAPGTYSSEVRLTSPDLMPEVVPKLRIILTVRPGPAPSLVAGPGLLTFTHHLGTAPPPAQKLTVRTIPESTAPFLIAVTGASWLKLSSHSGLTTNSVEVFADPEGLPIGYYTGLLSVYSNETADSPRTIVVTLTVANGSGPPALSITPLSVSLNTEPTDPPVMTQYISFSSTTDVPLSFQVAGASENWLAISARTGITPATIAVLVDCRKLAAGTFRANLMVRAVDAANSEIVLPVMVRMAPEEPVIEQVIHAASMKPGPIAPGQVIVVRGTGMGPLTLVTGAQSQGLLPDRVAETRVWFDGEPAPILYSQRNQVSVQFPYRLAGRTSTAVQLEYKGRKSQPVRVPVGEAAPGLFTADFSGAGQAAALTDTGAPNRAAEPAGPGSVLILTATGLGLVQPEVEDNRPAGLSGAVPRLPVAVSVGGEPAEVMAVETLPGAPTGLIGVRLRIPPGVPPGSAVPVRLTAGAASSQEGVTIAVGSP